MNKINLKAVGRDKPVATAKPYLDGSIHVRVDFELKPDIWAEVNMTSEQIRQLLQPEQNEEVT